MLAHMLQRDRPLIDRGALLEPVHAAAGAPGNGSTGRGRAPVNSCFYWDFMIQCRVRLRGGNCCMSIALKNADHLDFQEKGGITEGANAND